MRFLIAGASGFLGSRLCEHLILAGHDVTRLVRRPAGPGQAQWDPYGGTLDPALIEDSDVVINLAGSPTMGNPHSKRWAEDLMNSRVLTTRVLAEAIAASGRRPAYLAGNGISFYGDHGALPLPEGSPSKGSAYLTQVTIAWAQATQAATDAGARVCILRTSPVLDRRNAPLKQLLVLFKAGLGGKLGSGDQYFPIISTRDWVSAVAFVAGREDISGPVNLVCPAVPTNAEFTRELAALVHRPAGFGVPAAVLRAAAGQMAPELLGSVRAFPQVLLDNGFEFADPGVAEILRTATG